MNALGSARHGRDQEMDPCTIWRGYRTGGEVPVFLYRCHLTRVASIDGHAVTFSSKRRAKGWLLACQAFGVSDVIKANSEMIEGAGVLMM